MFYSQFILAKKGPLGTIWIAAHLERKLRKNQVADTDIGFSVDSILSPDVPIALRLSSHLLLGVVRIYSKKVNYLFDDCSEALLKIKQAFRSAAVDLPPEESKAPYHSITMPETFDLDDFELPDNDILQGNFVDHHISLREQITLQDTMEGVNYSTSKFGLDERFGDGDASELDLDEEILMGKTQKTESPSESADPGTSMVLKLNELSETTAVNAGSMVDSFHDHADLMDFAQAPCTPGLMEEPNVSKASASDDHLESEYHLVESSTLENAKESNSEDKHDADSFSHGIINSNVTPDVLNKENAQKSEMQIEVEIHLMENNTFELKPSTKSLGEAEVLFEVFEVPSAEASEKGASGEDIGISFSVGDEIGFEKSTHEVSGVTDSCTQGLGEVLANGQESQGTEVTYIEEISSDQQKLCADTYGSFPLNAETEDNHRDSELPHAHETEGSSETPFIRPCNYGNKQADSTIPGCGMYPDIYEQFDAVVLESSGKGVTAKLEAELHEPEKLMSAPEGHLDESRPVVMDSGPGELARLEEDDGGSKIISGKKRSFTESALTEQILNSVESSRLVRLKRTVESIPDDDDLLSSILVGHSSVLKVKPTPRLSEVTSVKRMQSAQRTGAPKRKVLMDDTMVLHGDMIRKQLMGTEDIRRVRKKAPCTRPEIWIIQNRIFGDDIFLEPVSSIMSNELLSMHRRLHDLRGITVCKSSQDGASSEIVVPDDQKLQLTSQLDIEIDDNHRRNGENPLCSSNAFHDVELNSNDCVNKDQARTYVSEKILLNAAGLEEKCRRTDDANSSFAVKANEMKTSLGANLSDIVPDEMTNAASELDSSLTDVNGHSITSGGLDKKESNINVHIELDHAVTDDSLLELGQDFTADLLTDAKERELEYNEPGVMSNDLLGQHATFSCPREVILHEDSFMDTDRNQERSESYLYDTVEGENLGKYMHDQDVGNLSEYSPVEIDTEFLNFDDDEDEQIGITDDPLPEDQDARFAENTGWSSRTRAVSKYLEALFKKEAECGRKCSLSMENLLIGKSRKEASRMFFEALVLKTKDHIHVEQQNPFGDIAIKPRANERLVKSNL